MKIFDRIALTFYWIALTLSVLLAIAGFVAPARQWIEIHSPFRSDAAGVIAVFATLAGCWIIHINKREYQQKPLPGWMYKLVFAWVVSISVIWFAFQIKQIFPDIKCFIYTAFLMGCIAGEFARPKRSTSGRRHEFF